MPSVDSLRDSFERAGVSDRSHVVVYYSSQAPSAARAVMALDYLGHDRVSFLDGGLPKWRAEGRPIETDRNARRARNDARQTAGKRDRDGSLDRVANRKARESPSLTREPTASTWDRECGTGCRARAISPARGSCSGSSSFRGTAGPRTASRSRAGPSSRSCTRIACIRATRVVTYCWVGYRASTTYLAARAVGLPVKLYDGSYEDWARRKLPLNTGAKP